MLRVPLHSDTWAALAALARRHGATPETMAADLLREAVIRAEIRRDAVEPNPPELPDSCRQQCAYPGCTSVGTTSSSTRGAGPWYCARHHRSNRDA